MKHGELKSLFKNWWQKQNPDGRIFENKTGAAKQGNRWVFYGIPEPIPKKRGKYGGGGGGDLIAGPGDGSIVVFEIKTIGDKLRPNQILAAEIFEIIGWPVFIVQELPGHPQEPWEIVTFLDYVSISQK